MAVKRDGWSGVRSRGEPVGVLRLRTAQWAWRCSSLSTPPCRAMGPRLLLCSVTVVRVGSCWGECQSIHVTSLVHVDVTRRSWMRALVSPLCWVHCWPMRLTSSVALDVTTPLLSCGRRAVEGAVSVQHEAAASGCISALSWRRLRGMVLHLSRPPCSSLPRLMWLDLTLVPCSPTVLSCA